MLIRFDGRTAIVAGAARGIGQAIARSLASDGARVLACDLLVDDLAVNLVLFVVGHALWKGVAAVLSAAEADGPDGVDLAVLQHSATPEIQHAFTVFEPIPIGSGVARGGKSEAGEPPWIREQAVIVM